MTDRLDKWPDIGVRATVPALLAAGAAKYGSKDFIVTRDERLTFVDAERQSRALAKRFIAYGVGKGTKIGVLLPSGPDFVVAFFAAARVGAVATLLSTTYRPAEIRRALRLSDVALLLAPNHLFGRDYGDDLEAAIDGLADAGPEPFRLPAMPYLRGIWLSERSKYQWAGVIHDDRGNPHDVSDELLEAVEQEVYPADALLGIWTSGSSADPKGVIHTHGVAVRKDSPAVGLGLPASFPEVKRHFLAMPFFWVAGPRSILGCLYTGNTIVTQARIDIAELLELVERERCTAISGWATTVEQVRGHPDYQKRDLSSLSPQQPRRRGIGVSSKGDPTNLGMTETFGPHAHPELFDYKVIDPETGESLPVGAEGEFCVRGFGLMLGLYRKEREETLDADGYYHTGDRGYIEDGGIFFTGRYSEAIKAGGANVAPLEVEQTMMSLPGVRLAFVFGLPHPTRQEEVTAVVVPENGHELDRGELRATMQKLLSNYKIPTRIDIVAIEDVPFLATGKPDKRSMKEARQKADL